MVVYKSDVRDVTFKIDGDWFISVDRWGMIGFRISTRNGQESYYRLMGDPGEAFRNEVERVINAVLFIREPHERMKNGELQEAIAKKLGMTYGKYMEKKKKREIRYVPGDK